MTHGSLFAGIGGFELGFERAGIETLWQVELEDYCRKVLEKNFPNATRYAEIRECGAHNLARVDIISGGFPCQDISNAGKRAGIEGDRSGLWSEMLRIVCELRPRYVVVENVSALLGRGMGRVLGDLAQSGYDAEWDCLPAAAFGAPHLRDRVFVIAYPHSGGCRATVLPTGQGHQGAGEIKPLWVGENLSESLEYWTHAADSQKNRRQGPVRRYVAHRLEKAGMREWKPASALDSRFFIFDWFEKRMGQPAVFGVADGVPARVDRLGGVGNAIVPQIAEWIGHRILAAEVLSDRQAGGRHLPVRVVREAADGADRAAAGVL